jgi:hypothetical protein
LVPVSVAGFGTLGIFGELAAAARPSMPTVLSEPITPVTVGGGALVLAGSARPDWHEVTALGATCSALSG